MIACVGALEISMLPAGAPQTVYQATQQQLFVLDPALPGALAGLLGGVQHSLRSYVLLRVILQALKTSMLPAGAPQAVYQAPQQQHSVVGPALLGAGAGLLGGVLLEEAIDRPQGGFGGGWGGGGWGGNDDGNVSAPPCPKQTTDILQGCRCTCLLSHCPGQDASEPAGASAFQGTQILMCACNAQHAVQCPPSLLAGIC